MSQDPFAVVRQFEQALCEYTGAPYCVTVTSCTMALLLAVAWHLRDTSRGQRSNPLSIHYDGYPERTEVEIPKRTYVSVPMSIIHAGGHPTFRDEDWKGFYRLRPLPVWDCARLFTSGMYTQCAEGAETHSNMLCLSFHWSKTLGIEQGGAILHDSAEADEWLRQARFDGRIETLSPKTQANCKAFNVVGWHAYMSPETAAAGLVRLRLLPRHNEPLPPDDYPDLSELEIFK